MAFDRLVGRAVVGQINKIGPWPWQPQSCVVQNRSNVTQFFGDGRQPTVDNYDFMVPPYHQGAFVMGSKQGLWQLQDPNGTIGPIPIQENVTVQVLDEWVAPSLTGFARTNREFVPTPNLRPITNTQATSVANSVTVSFSLTPTSGIYELYGWRAWVQQGALATPIGYRGPVNVTLFINNAFGGANIDQGQFWYNDANPANPSQSTEFAVHYDPPIIVPSTIGGLGFVTFQLPTGANFANGSFCLASIYIQQVQY